MAAATSLRGPVTGPRAPSFPSLSKMPTTPKELFLALGGTIESGSYAAPWAGYTGWQDAGERLLHFCGCNTTAWMNFNGNASNEGIMTAPSHPDKALIENVMNAIDSKLEYLMAQYLKGHAGETSLRMPSSPFEAVQLLSGGYSPDQLPGMTNTQIANLAKESLQVRLFASQKRTLKEKGESNRCIVDIRDFGCGIPPELMATTILSLNRGGPSSKKHKPYVCGKHGQGAGGTYQYAVLSLIATRVRGSKTVAFTVVTRQFDDATIKTPTFKYLTMNGKVLTFEIENEADFPPGLLMRHIGYQGDLLMAKDGLYGVLQRMLPRPLYPIQFQHIVMDPSEKEDVEKGPGYINNRHLYGAAYALERAAHITANPDPNKPRKAQEFKPTYSTKVVIHLGDYDFGGIAGIGMGGVAPAGSVTMTAWAIDPRKYNDGKYVENETRNNTLKMYVNPSKPILLTLDGQTHDEQSHTFLTSEERGAGLTRIGQYMVVHIDCNGLTRDARHELFSSLRETTKQTPLQRKIMERVVDILKQTPKFQELQHDLKVQIPSDTKRDEDWAKGFKEHCTRDNLKVEHLTIRSTGYREVWQRQKGRVTRKEQGPPVAIPTVEPPTMLKWANRGPFPLKMYPGQNYSFVLETNAHPDYWTPEDPANSKIRLSLTGIEHVHSGLMVGGRIRIGFRCPDNAAIGSTRLITAHLPGVPDADLPIIVKPRPEEASPPGGPNKPLHRGTKHKNGPDYVMVKVRVKDEILTDVPILRPIATNLEDPPGAWSQCGWESPDDAGLRVEQEEDGIRVYYNAMLPKFLKCMEDFAKQGAAELFRTTYEYKIVTYAIIHLNHGVVLESEIEDEEQKKVLRTLYTSIADDLAYEAQREVAARLADEKEAIKSA